MNDSIVYQAEINYKNDYENPANPHPGETLLALLDYCFQANIEVPEWARVAYRKSYKKYTLRIGGDPLVTAFDTDPDAGIWKHSQALKRDYLTTVSHTLWYLHIELDWRIDKGLFEEVAKRHGDIKGLSGSTVEGWYYGYIKPMINILGGGFPIKNSCVKQGKTNTSNKKFIRKTRKNKKF